MRAIAVVAAAVAAAVPVRVRILVAILAATTVAILVAWIAILVAHIAVRSAEIAAVRALARRTHGVVLLTCRLPPQDDLEGESYTDGSGGRVSCRLAS